MEQRPWAAKLLLGAASQFVQAPETCPRLPEFARVAGAVLPSAAATAPAIPTGFWDRRPQPTPGRHPRFLARTPPRKSVRDSPAPQGIPGAAANPCHARHTHDPGRSSLRYHKPEN